MDFIRLQFCEMYRETKFRDEIFEGCEGYIASVSSTTRRYSLPWEVLGETRNRRKTMEKYFW